MTIRRKHWFGAFLVAVLAHASLLVLLWEPPESGAANLGTGGVDIAFGMAGGAPGATEVAPPETETVEATETPVETVTETPPIETLVTTEVPEVVETLAVEPVAVEAAEPVENLETAMPVEMAVVEPKTQKAIMPKKPTPPRPEVTETPPVPAPAPTKPAETARPQEVASLTPPSVAGSGGKSGTKDSAAVGDGDSTSSGGRPGSSDSYFALLQAWLEKHKEYPTSAMRRRHEGTAVLNFTVSRSGEVLNARLLDGTGYRSLDREVMRMIQRASPLPPFPRDFEEEKLTLSVPVQFRLH